jgi:hypothetical protein
LDPALVGRLSSAARGRVLADVEVEQLTRAIEYSGPVTDRVAEVLVGVIDLPAFLHVRDRLLDLIESAPGWPLWGCLERPTPGVVDLRMRLMARGHRPMEMG